VPARLSLLQPLPICYALETGLDRGNQVTVIRALCMAHRLLDAEYDTPLVVLQRREYLKRNDEFLKQRLWVQLLTGVFWDINN